jgi:long-chain acyl-CoA synthetase
MAHVFEKVIFLSFICAGAKIGFSSGDNLKLKDDIALLKPTIFASVPRIYNRFYDAIKGQVGKLTGYKKKIADYGVSAK